MKTVESTTVESQADHEAAAGTRPYAPPTILRFGKLGNLTAASSAGGMEDMMGMDQNAMP